MDSSLEYNWVIDPYKENKRRLGIITMIILTFLFTVFIATGELIWVLISLILFILSLHKYFFKTKYTLTDDKIIIDHLGKKSERNWTEFKRVEFHNTGIFLSPFKKNSRLDSFRGVFILYGKMDKTNINEKIFKFLPEDIEKMVNVEC